MLLSAGPKSRSCLGSVEDSENVHIEHFFKVVARQLESGFDDGDTGILRE